MVVSQIVAQDKQNAATFMEGGCSPGGLCAARGGNNAGNVGWNVRSYMSENSVGGGVVTWDGI